MTLERTVATSEAHITTATVDIQVIRIGRKQMTLAVFRQLRYKDIFGETGALRSAPWGWVNYTTGEDFYGRQYVFAFEGMIFRARVDIQAISELKVKPEMDASDEPGKFVGNEYIPARTIRTPTGRWNITHHRIGLFLTFDTESDARIHQKNRLDSITTLNAAPQLFIAV